MPSIIARPRANRAHVLRNHDGHGPAALSATEGSGNRAGSWPGRTARCDQCLPPAVSVITSISFDHMQQLGNTLAAIAGEKAGIIKPGVPVVSGVVEPEARDVIRQVCRKHGCRLIERDTDFAFDYHPPRHLERDAVSGQVVYRQVAASDRSPLPPGEGQGVRAAKCFRPCLPGRHQAANAATALATLDVLRRRLGTFPGRPSNEPWPVYRVRPGCKS